MNRLSINDTSCEPKEAKLPDRRGETSFHSALKYLQKGWSVLPLAGKTPALRSWRQYQLSRPNAEQIHEWFSASETNIGIVTGRLSGLVVVDCDTAEDAEYWQKNFPRTPLTVCTGGGGAHFYYRYPDDEDVGNRAGLLSRRIDLRGEGGYVVAPPSKHPNGTHYEWFSGDDDRLESVPFFSSEWLIEKSPRAQTRASSRSVKSPASYIRSIRAISGEGGHNQTFRAACVLRDAGLSPEEALCELMLWNETHATPPWSARELLHKVQSAFKAHT